MREFSEWLSSVRERVDAHLGLYLDAKVEEAKSLSPDSLELVDGIRSLTMRGGKRFRPLVLEAAFLAVSAKDAEAITTPAGAALEMLQSYLLIHDDWMDQDDERRGGPAVHAMYRESHERHLADALGILAGDLAAAYSLELLMGAPIPAAQLNEAIHIFLRIQKEVFFGQHLDITANADVTKMHDLKTGSYTVRGPLLLGAALADASEEQTAALVAFANPLGEAFQLADDILGTFGDTDATGKPGNDLRNGKRTSLVSEAERLLSGNALAPLSTVMNGGASESEIAAASELLVTSGARANVEKRLTERLDEAKAVLASAPLNEEGKQRLRVLADRLAVRSE